MVDPRRQIELIQDFDMPAICTSIRMTQNEQYILATGTYKPRLKCFEVCNFSIKFERCLDAEVITFETLCDDYSKIALLQCDRFIEIHAASGRQYRLRIPHIGLDMKYCKPTCDLFLVGNSKDIYRLNLERGQFLKSYETACSAFNACDINLDNGLLAVGAKEGIIEAWDPRSKTRCSSLDVAISLDDCNFFPSVTAITFKNGLEMGVGTASGHVLLYDLRSRHPLIIKDHLNKEPIKRIAFNKNLQTVYSLDEAMLKVWNEHTGKQVAYIESATKFNDFCTISSSGIFFIGQEDAKILSYYIPAMGPAPRWCSFLDNLTDEIESEAVEHIYDDYQFVTPKELGELGLDNLYGTNLLRNYMHGYFIDVRLYNKAKSLTSPFSFNQFRKENIKDKIDNERRSRLELKLNLPKVNPELAMKITSQQEQTSSGTKGLSNLMKDTRFKDIFENPDFSINPNDEEYKVLAPTLHKIKTREENKKRLRINFSTPDLHAKENANNPESDNDEDLFGIRKSTIENISNTESGKGADKHEVETAFSHIHKELKSKCVENIKKPKTLKRSKTSMATNAHKFDQVGSVFQKKSKYSETTNLNYASKDLLHDRVKRTEYIYSRDKAIERSFVSRKINYSVRGNGSQENKKKSI